MVKRKQILIMCVFLTAATFIAFWRVTHCEITNNDDPDYVTESSHDSFEVFATAEQYFMVKPWL